jgi:hypothetical protein
VAGLIVGGAGLNLGAGGFTPPANFNLITGGAGGTGLNLLSGIAGKEMAENGGPLLFNQIAMEFVITQLTWMNEYIVHKHLSKVVEEFRKGRDIAKHPSFITAKSCAHKLLTGALQLQNSQKKP